MVINMKNLLINDDYIIGKIEDIEKYLREEMICQLKDIDLDCEELKYNFELMFDIILEIQENEQENIDNGCLFKITPNLMGGYNYIVLKEK